VKGIAQILYALISFAVTFSVIVVILVDLLVTHQFDGRDVLYILATIIALWAQSPGQPLLDKANKKT
jgi:hypothetical protein